MNKRVLDKFLRSIRSATSSIAEGHHYDAVRLLLLKEGFTEQGRLYPDDSGVRGARFTNSNGTIVELSCGDLFGVFTDLQFKPCKQA